MTAIRGVQGQIDIETAQDDCESAGALGGYRRRQCAGNAPPEDPIQQESAQKEQGGIEHV